MVFSAWVEDTGGGWWSGLLHFCGEDEVAALAFFDDVPSFGDFGECDIFSVEPLVIGEVDEKVTAAAVVAWGFESNPEGAFDVAHW